VPDNFAGTIIKGLGLPSGVKYKFLNPAAGAMIQTGHSITFFWADSAAVGETLKAQNEKVDLEFCYCSIYDECWLGRSGSPVDVRDDSCGTFANEPRSFWWNG
jgi:hypothetical protein